MVYYNICRRQREPPHDAAPGHGEGRLRFGGARAGVKMKQPYSYKTILLSIYLSINIYIYIYI